MARRYPLRDEHGHTPVASSAPDRRRHKRVGVTLLGRFMRASKQEYPCKLIDISVGGAAMISPVSVDLDERIVAYFDHVSGLEGNVARIFDGGFAIQLSATQHKREKLAGSLTWLINRKELAGEERRHSRSSLHDTRSILQLDEGIAVPCTILNVSISGASLATDARPVIGHEVVVGKLRARVTRHQEDGISVAFLDIQNPLALRRYFE